MEKTVKITWEGNPGEVVLGELLHREVSMVRREMGEVKMNSRTGETTISMERYCQFEDKMMLLSIKKAPFEVNLKNIGELTATDADKLIAASKELNPLLQA